MLFRCAHCRAPLELVDGKPEPCADHPDGGVEWCEPVTEPDDGV